jgi:hypothetical protein
VNAESNAPDPGQRLERGELQQDQLEIAAHLGHGPARRALGLGPAPHDWLEDLSGWGRRVLVRASVGVALWALPLPLGDELRPVEAAVEAAEAWVDDPSEANRVLARMAHEELEALTRELEARGVVDDDFALELELAARTAQAASDLRPEAAEYHFREALSRLAGLSSEEHAQAKEAMRQSLLAWALGEPDPLRE